MDKTLDQEMDAHQRVEYLIKNLGKNENSFAVALGVNSSQIYNITKGSSSKGGKKTKPSFDLLTNICETFPQVNLTWLITGKGSPLLNDEEIASNQEMDIYLNSDVSKALISELKEVIQDQKNREKIHLETISNLSKR